MRALVTGSRGFVGRHLVAHLHYCGDTVIGLDRSGPDPVDVTDADRVRHAVRSTAPDVVFHLAAFSHVGDSWGAADLESVNVAGTRNVLDACAAADVGMVVAVGSAEEYGVATTTPVTESHPLRPLTPYGESKAQAEGLALQFARRSEVPVVAVRAFNHTGPGQSPRFLVPGLAARIARAEREDLDEITIGNLSPVRDVSDVRDVVRAYRLLAERGTPGEAYNVCSGTGATVGDLAAALLALAKRPLELVVDAELARPVDVPVMIGDPTKLHGATGWQPEIPLDRTLADVLADARASM
jgi:GDP-4-dehydro-6-deoxy-D-mannose reductase